MIGVPFLIVEAIQDSQLDVEVGDEDTHFHDVGSIIKFYIYPWGSMILGNGQLEELCCRLLEKHTILRYLRIKKNLDTLVSSGLGIHLSCPFV